MAISNYVCIVFHILAPFYLFFLPVTVVQKQQLYELLLTVILVLSSAHVWNVPVNTCPQQ